MRNASPSCKCRSPTPVPPASPPARPRTTPPHPAAAPLQKVPPLAVPLAAAPKARYRRQSAGRPLPLKRRVARIRPVRLGRHQRSRRQQNIISAPADAGCSATLSRWHRVRCPPVVLVVPWQDFISNKHRYDVFEVSRHGFAVLTSGFSPEIGLEFAGTANRPHRDQPSVRQRWRR